MPSHGNGGVTSSRPQVENKSPHDRKIARGFFVSGRRGGERTSAFSCTVAAAESVYRHAAVPTAEGRQKTSHCSPRRGRRPTFPRVPTAPPCAPLRRHSLRAHRVRPQSGDTAQESKRGCVPRRLPRRAHLPKGVAIGGPRGAPSHHKTRSWQKAHRATRATRPIEMECRANRDQAEAATAKVPRSKYATTAALSRQREADLQPPRAPCPIPKQCIAAGIPLRATWGNGVRPRTIAPKATLPVRPRAKGRAGRASDKVGATVIRSFSWLNGFALSPHRGVPSSDNRKHRRRRSPPRSNRAPTP